MVVNVLDELGEYWRTSNLAEGLQSRNINRVMEFGTGTNLGNIISLMRLEVSGKSVLTPDPDNVLVVDPSLPADEQLTSLLPANLDINWIPHLRCNVQTIRDQIQEGTREPFDLIVGRGVVSVGNLGDGTGIREVILKAREIIESIRDCLNPANPEACAVIAARSTDSILAISGKDMEELGLEIAYSLKAEGDQAKRWLKALISKSAAGTSESDFYYLAILKRKQDLKSTEF